MNLIQRLMGRRQFLIGSMASASALTFTKLVKGNSVAMASDSTANVVKASGTPGTGYTHFLSPLKIRNRILKNRIHFTPATPMKMQVFTGSAGQVLLLGDCTGQAGTVQKTIRSAFFMASQV